MHDFKSITTEKNGGYFKYRPLKKFKVIKSIFNDGWSFFCFTFSNKPAIFQDINPATGMTIFSRFK